MFAQFLEAEVLTIWNVLDLLKVDAKHGGRFVSNFTS